MNAQSPSFFLNKSIHAPASASPPLTFWNVRLLIYFYTSSDGKVLGLFTASHLSYDHDRLSEGEESDEPSIMEMTKAALEFLSKNHDGYYLLVEAGRVDHASHAGNMHRT